MKILIVDDERATRETLLHFVDWKRLGIPLVETAAQGLEALEKMKSDPADILLTDVKMPKMDGIELSRQVRSIYPETSIIFLSGYSEKDFLKNAIQVQAVDFIDKPLDLNEVQTVLERAVQAQDKSRDLRQNLENIIPLCKQNLLEELLAHQGKAQDCQKTTLAALWESLMEGLVRVGVGIPRWASTTELKFRLEAVLEFSRHFNTLKLPKGNLLCAPYKSEFLLFLFDNDHLEDEAITRLLTPELEALAQESRNQKLAAFHVGLAPAQPLHLMSQAIVLAQAASSRSFYHPEKLIFFHSERNTRSFELERAWDEKLMSAMEVLDEEKLLALLDDTEKKAQSIQDCDTQSVRLKFYDITAFLLKKMPLWSALQIRVAQESALQEITALPTLGETAEFVRTFIRRHFGSEKNEFPLKRKIDRAKAFIAAHFGDHNLSIDRVAECVDLSEAYLCTVFKQGTGVTVHEYITQVRVEKAKELLGDEMLNLQSVAWGVGFRDPNYFGTVFRKVTGFTPGQYRRSLDS